MPGGKLFGLGKYKTWTPGPWTPFLDRVHEPLSWTGSMDPISWTGSMEPLFLLPLKLLKENKNEISKLKEKNEFTVMFQININEIYLHYFWKRSVIINT